MQVYLYLYLYNTYIYLYIGCFFALLHGTCIYAGNIAARKRVVKTSGLAHLTADFRVLELCLQIRGKTRCMDPKGSAGTCLASRLTTTTPEVRPWSRQGESFPSA